MKIKIKDALALFIALGFQTATKWDAERFNGKFAKLAKIINDPDEINPESIKDKDTRKLFDQIAAAIEKGDAVTVEADEAPAEKTPKKAEKPAKAKKEEAPAKDESEDEESDDEDESEDEESEEEEAPAKKSSKKKEEKAPAKKAAPEKKAVKKSTEGVSKDAFGAREGSGAAAVNACLGKKPRTTEEIVEKSGVLKATVQEHLWKLRAVLKYAQRDEKGWTLTEKGAKLMGK